jgi:hypothetical protein
MPMGISGIPQMGQMSTMPMGMPGMPQMGQMSTMPMGMSGMPQVGQMGMTMPQAGTIPQMGFPGMPQMIPQGQGMYNMPNPYSQAQSRELHEDFAEETEEDE